MPRKLEERVLHEEEYIVEIILGVLRG